MGPCRDPPQSCAPTPCSFSLALLACFAALTELRKQMHVFVLRRLKQSLDVFMPCVFYMGFSRLAARTYFLPLSLRLHRWGDGGGGGRVAAVSTDGGLLHVECLRRGFQCLCRESLEPPPSFSSTPSSRDLMMLRRSDTRWCRVAKKRTLPLCSSWKRWWC